MKKILFSIVLMLVLLALPTPAAAGKKVPVGERVILTFGGTDTFTAGAPFHIAHGWILEFNTDSMGIFDFKLEVDGVPLKEDFVDRTVTSENPDQFTKLWTFNFPNGMTGTHIFTGYWYTPCQAAVDDGVFPGPCLDPNKEVEYMVRTRTVTFISP